MFDIEDNILKPLCEMSRLSHSLPDYIDEFQQCIQKTFTLINSSENMSKKSLLHYMVQYGDVKLINIYKHQFNENYTNELNSKDKHGSTPLHSIISNTNLLDVVKYLLDEEEIDIDAEDDEGRTPLYISISNNNIKMIRLLLKHGADPNKEISINDTKMIRTLLKHSDIQFVRLSNNEISNGNLSKYAYCGEPPLIYAIRKGYHDSAKLLIEYDASINDSIRASDYGVQVYGDTALHFATKYEQTSTVELLLEYEADVNVVNELGQTPLFYAVNESRNYEIIKLLIEYGARIDIIDKHGKSMFDYIKNENKRIKVESFINDCLKSTNSNQSDDEPTEMIEPIIQDNSDERCKCNIVFNINGKEIKCSINSPTTNSLFDSLYGNLAEIRYQLYSLSSSC